MVRNTSREFSTESHTSCCSNRFIFGTHSGISGHPRHPSCTMHHVDYLYGILVQQQLCPGFAEALCDPAVKRAKRMQPDSSCAWVHKVHEKFASPFSKLLHGLPLCCDHLHNSNNTRAPPDPRPYQQKLAYLPRSLTRTAASTKRT